MKNFLIQSILVINLYSIRFVFCEIGCTASPFNSQTRVPLFDDSGYYGIPAGLLETYQQQYPNYFKNYQQLQPQPFTYPQYQLNGYPNYENARLTNDYTSFLRLPHDSTGGLTKLGDKLSINDLLLSSQQGLQGLRNPNIYTTIPEINLGTYNLGGSLLNSYKDFNKPEALTVYTNGNTYPTVQGTNEYQITKEMVYNNSPKTIQQYITPTATSWTKYPEILSNSNYLSSLGSQNIRGVSSIGSSPGLISGSSSSSSVYTPNLFDMRRVYGANKDTQIPSTGKPDAERRFLTNEKNSPASVEPLANAEKPAENRRSENDSSEGNKTESKKPDSKETKKENSESRRSGLQTDVTTPSKETDTKQKTN